MKDATATFGSILPKDVGGRDAVHVAVIAVVANTKLAPGQDIGITNTTGQPETSKGAQPIGIVDPFLEEMVWPGERFWLFLYPRTITSLRHQWAHPALEDAAGVYATPAHKMASKERLEEIAGQLGVDYATLIAATTYYASLNVDEGYVGFGTDINYIDMPSDFWLHFENVTGTVAKNKPTTFRCSC